MLGVSNIDKVKHFVAGFFVALAFGLVISLSAALLAGAVVAFGKEIYDYYRPTMNTADGLDIVATMVGVVFAVEVLR